MKSKRKLKDWAQYGLISLVVSLAGMGVWLARGDGQLTVGLIMSVIAFVFCGFVIQRGFRLGFFETVERDTER